MFNKLIIITIAMFFMFNITFAETIYLKSGKTLEGKITEETNDYLKVDFYGVILTYYRDEIEKIERTPLIETKENYYVNKEYGISIIFPNNWHIYKGGNLRKIIELEAKLFEQTYSDYEKSNEEILVRATKYPYGSQVKFNPNIGLSTIDIRNYSEMINNPLNYLNSILPALQKMKNFILLQKPKTIMQNDIELARTVFEVEFIENIKMKYNLFCFMRNSKVFLLTGLTSSDDKEDEDVFQSVINSLKIL